MQQALVELTALARESARLAPASDELEWWGDRVLRGAVAPREAVRGLTDEERRRLLLLSRSLFALQLAHLDRRLGPTAVDGAILVAAMLAAASHH
jgi:hypothetical protein